MKAALGCIALMTMIGWSTLPPERAARTSSRPGDPENTTMTVMLQVPEGLLAEHLTVVDASGRELAVLTHWISGMTSVVSRRRDETSVSYILNSNGSATMQLKGTERVTLINAQKDGTTEVSHRVVPTRDNPQAMMRTETPPASDERLPLEFSVGGTEMSPEVVVP
jgi:hypothetical protein